MISPGTPSVLLERAGADVAARRHARGVEVTAPVLVVLAGPPGTGKTTIARSLAECLGAVYLRIDSIEQAMRRSVLCLERAEDAGYLIAYSLAEDNLRNGLDVVADSVNGIELTRRAWQEIAERSSCRLVDVELTCSDVAEHRRRVEQRLPDREGQRLPTWEDVIGRTYEPWRRYRLTIDTAHRSPEEAVDYIRSCLQRDSVSG
jgi:predicted kinase